MEKTIPETKYYYYNRGEVTIGILKDLIPQSYVEEYRIEFNDDSIGFKYDNNRYDIYVKSIERIRIIDNVCVEMSASNFSITIYDGIKNTQTIFL
jgi:DNA-directed RNA polymerase subunit E'/Rpb7